MTTEEGNRLIAEFDGWTFENRDEFNRPSKLLFARKATPYTILLLENLKYHSSWDWLMGVVEKINATAIPDNKFPASVHIYRSTVHVNDDDNIIIETTATREGGLILAVYQAVVQFIEWYNQSKNTQS